MPSAPIVRADLARGAGESARFFDFAGGQIYTVTHAAAGARRGAVLLCGPFGVERERAYLTLVLWARILAARGFEVMRFDYRGTGESSGNFEDMTIARCRDDTAFCAARLSAANHGATLVLQGVRLGALFAAELFARGSGDALLLWAPPVSAEALLRDTLRHNLIVQRIERPELPPMQREQLIAKLEAGEFVNVDGYFWTLPLWSEAQSHPLPLPPASETRPWHLLRAQAGPVAASKANTPPGRETVSADNFWNSSSCRLVPRSEGFFDASLRWLDANESRCEESSRRDARSVATHKLREPSPASQACIEKAAVGLAGGGVA